MGYLPIFLNTDGLRCLVVGGGEVAHRKVRGLVEAGSSVTVISPRLIPAISTLAAQGAITHIQRTYRSGDMNGFAIVYAATNDHNLHREIASEARGSGILVNVADDPKLCSFIAPAIAQRGTLQIAVSTGGDSPALASRIRSELEAQFGGEYETMLRILRAARLRLGELVTDSSARAHRLTALVNSPLARELRAGDYMAVDRILEKHLGSGFGLEQLGIDLEHAQAKNRPSRVG